jgi:membrane protease subunit (stomatin/prohibitin family)
MALIKALTSAATTALGDQFKEYVTCPTTENNVIIQRGEVHHGAGNPGASEGVISNGSAIVIPQGMAMMIVDNGKVAEFSAEPGTFTWDTSSEPSIFIGGLGKGLLNTIKTIGNRFTFGGQTAKDQRVYYINIKKIMSNPFGSQQPETVEDPVYGSVEITYNGEYTIRIDDPIILVNNVVGTNAKDTLTFDDIFGQDGINQLKSQFSQHVSEAIASIMLDNRVSFNQIQRYKSEITTKMNDLLDQEWRQEYGLIVEGVTLRINASEESLANIREIDRKDSSYKRLGKTFAENEEAKNAAMIDVMQTAAGNPNGSMMGLFGTAMAGNAMGAIMGNGNNQAANNNNQAANNNTQASNDGASAANTAEETKICPSCGAQVSGNFCSKCGAQLN